MQVVVRASFLHFWVKDVNIQFFEVNSSKQLASVVLPVGT